MDIAAAWHNGKVWFKVPQSVKLNFIGNIPDEISAKDIVLNLLKIFGANTLLGFSVEMYGESIDKLSIDDRITISSMATEMGAIIILFPPSQEIIEYCSLHANKKFTDLKADDGASYYKSFDIDVSQFKPMVSLPGKPHDTVNVLMWKELKLIQLSLAVVPMEGCRICAWLLQFLRTGKLHPE